MNLKKLKPREKLIAAANAAGGDDNITAMVVDWSPAGRNAP